MNSYIFEGVVTALSSISHIGESYGVNSMLRREKVIQPDGSVEDVPIISGNAMRGVLRDRGMLHMLKKLGYGVNEPEQTVKGLSLPAFYFLFSGGALSKTGGTGLDVDNARKWREAIPLVSIFGGAMGNQIMPGKLKMGKLMPICAETAHLLPERVMTKKEKSVWDYCQQEAYTRRDDEKNDNLRPLLDAPVRLLLGAEAAGKRAKAGTKDDITEKTGQSQQMRYFVETFGAGTRFFWEIVLDDITELEFDAFCVVLAEFGRFPYIGGKSNVGHGKIAVQFDQWHEINPRLELNGKAVDVTLGTKYMAHLAAHSGDIRGLIDGLQ